MKHVVFDCDNTFGVKDCDVDDGLALLYLLGCEDVCVHGITATYGNNKIDVVCDVITGMLKDIGREDIVLKKGGSKAGDYNSEAAEYLVEMANKFKGELSILATGSMTNLQGAYEKDPQFYEKVKEIVVMGGITSPLIFEKKVMDELNLSCDPYASCNMLRYGRNVSVVSANNCLKALFSKEEYKKVLFESNLPVAKYIREGTDYYFAYNEDDYGIKGFYNWDVTAAVYLVHKELFTDKIFMYDFSVEDLKTGFLREDVKGKWKCNLPEIGEIEAFKQNIYRTWLNVKM